MVIRVQMGFPSDSALPKDIITLNPHFNAGDATALLNSLKTNLNAWSGTAGKPFTLKAYDATKLPPSYPLATVSQTGSTPNSTAPREVALCLSYYANFNRPRFRGRLYLPGSWLTAAPNVRPADPTIATALTFKDVVGKNLPSGAFWTVWSTVTRTDAQVTNAWVDDEWDTIRSRGMVATKRVTGTV